MPLPLPPPRRKACSARRAAVFTKGFYMQLGADTDAMQTSYIFRTGGKMLLMALLLAVCAISVGFCGSRMGRGHRAGSAAGYFRKSDQLYQQ